MDAVWRARVHPNAPTLPKSMPGSAADFRAQEAVPALIGRSSQDAGFEAE